MARPNPGGQVKPISPKQRRLLRHLASQADAVRASHDWYAGRDLAELLQALRFARPRARTVRYAGIRFPILHSLCTKVAACPVSGRPLVGVADA